MASRVRGRPEGEMSMRSKFRDVSVGFKPTKEGSLVHGGSTWLVPITGS